MPDQNKAELYQEYLAAGAMQGTGLTFDQWLDSRAYPTVPKKELGFNVPIKNVTSVVNPKTGVAMPIGSPDYRLFQKQQAEKEVRMKGTTVKGVVTNPQPATSPTGTTTQDINAPATLETKEVNGVTYYWDGDNWKPLDPAYKQTGGISAGEQAKLEESRRQTDIANAYNQQNLVWEKQQWQENLAWQKQQAETTAAQERQKWLTELSKQPSNWIQYYEAMYSKLPEAPQWLNKYMGGDVNRQMSETTPATYYPTTTETTYPSDELKTVKWNAFDPKYTSPENMPELTIGQGGAPYFIIRDTQGQIIDLVPLQGAPTGTRTLGGGLKTAATTSNWTQISPQNVATPSGQWLNQTAPTVRQGLQGYANWSAGQNKSQTWEDLMGNVNQMLPTSAPYERGRWDATRKAGW